MRILKSKQNKNGKERKQNKKKTKTEKREKELRPTDHFRSFCGSQVSKNESRIYTLLALFGKNW
jgi:hypothetical protein